MLNNPNPAPETDPFELFRLRDGMYAADLLVTAIGHLDFFTEVKKLQPDFKGLCMHFKIDERCADVLLTYCISLGLISLENGRYVVTKKSTEFLLSSSPWTLVPYFNNHIGRPIVDKMLNALKTGEPQSWGGKQNEKDWASAMERPDFSATFTAGMDARAAYMAPGIVKNFDFSKYESILDIGGASGIYAATIIDHNPHMKGGILEKSPVNRISELYIAKNGLQNVMCVYEGNMFKSIPPGFDIHLFSHVLHDWNEEQNTVLIRNSFESLNRGGIVMIHDAHINSDKTGPVSVAEYSILLMFATPGKCYSITELGLIMKSVGFVDIQEIKTIGNRSLIIGTKE